MNETRRGEEKGKGERGRGNKCGTTTKDKRQKTKSTKHTHTTKHKRREVTSHSWRRDKLNKNRQKKEIKLEMNLRDASNPKIMKRENRKTSEIQRSPNIRTRLSPSPTHNPCHKNKDRKQQSLGVEWGEGGVSQSQQSERSPPRCSRATRPPCRRGTAQSCSCRHRT